MVKYIDKTGAPINEGDILLYDERPGDKDVGRGIHVVESGSRGLAGRCVIGHPAWSKIHEDPIELRFYTTMGWSNRHLDDNVCTACTVIGNVKDNPEMLEPEYAIGVWPEEVEDESPSS